MSALVSDSVLLGFIPAYLHVSISFPRYISGVARDFFLVLLVNSLRFLKEDPPKIARVVTVPFSSLSRNFIWVPTVSLTTGKGTMSANSLLPTTNNV